MRYMKIRDQEGNERTDMIKKIDDGNESFVPCVIDNRDYQQYLTWIAEGNIIEDAPLEPQ